MNKHTLRFICAMTIALVLIFSMAMLSTYVYNRTSRRTSAVTPVASEFLEKYVREDGSIICGMVLFKETGSSKEAECILFGRDAGKSEIRQLYDDADHITLIPGAMMLAPTYAFLIEKMNISLEEKLPTHHGFLPSGRQDVHIADYEIATGLDSISMRESFFKSSKYAIEKIADENPGQLYRYLSRFGDFFGDSDAQLLPNYVFGHGREFGSIACGYGLMLSPKQILTFYDAIANNGVRARERYLRSRRICSAAAADTIAQLLDGNVKEGTGCVLRDCTVPISGKPGLGKYERGHLPGRWRVSEKDDIRVSSFAGYFPSKSPKYTMLVSLFCVTKFKTAEVMDLYGDIVEEMYNREMIW